MSDKFPGGLITTGAPAGFSVAFGATTSKLSIASMTALGSDFTIECWIYPTSFADYNTIWDNRTSDADASGCALGLTAANKAYFYTNSSFQLTTTTALTANRWTHLALVRSGSGSGNVKIYINGVADATTATYTTSFSRTAASIGGDWNTRSNLQFFGYISNFRTLTTALYTTTFTPPTQLFPVTSTTLLTCQSPTIIDNSSSAVAITLAGSTTPVVSNFTPFAGYKGFNPALGAAAGGVWTLDEAAYYQQNRLWPIYDPYFNQTTLMLHGNGTNGAQNNTFLDSSTNNFTITRNGNTTQGTFTPFSQTGWGNYFDGSADGFSYSGTTFGSGAWTVELWFYFTGSSFTGPIQFFEGTTNSLVLAIMSSTTIRVDQVNVSNDLYTVPTMSANTWYHVAATKDASGNQTLFLNGVRSSTGVTTTSRNFSTATLRIAYSTIGGTDFTGYYSNLRFVTGTAVYNPLSSTITVPTTPLTAISGTQLLTCQSNRFIDNSSNAYSLTVNSTPSVQAFSPFVPTVTTPTTYSNWFNGSTGYLTTPNAAWMNLGTGDFTMECWVQFNSVSTTQMFVSNNYNAGTGAGGWAFLYRQDNTTLKFTCNSNVSYEKTWSPNIGTMYHLAVCRSSTNLRLFVNGVQVGTTSTSSDNIAGASSTLVVGNNLGGTPLPINGVISNMRIVTSALYTASFTPPTTPLSAITNTQLLTCQNNTFIDNSANAAVVTATGAVYPVTSPTPFPAKVDQTTLNTAYSTSLIGGSGYFDGTGDYLSFSGPTIGTGAFCLEAWVYCTSTFTNQAIFGADGTNNRISILINSATAIAIDQYGVSGSVFTVPTMALNAWNHIAVSRNGSSATTIFVNGVRSSTGVVTLTNNYTTFNAIGRFASSDTRYPTGYIAGARATIGSTPYDPNSTGFAVPYAPPTAITNTQFLVNYTNAGIIDNTSKSVLETVSTAQISTAQSKFGGSSMFFNGSGNALKAPYSPNMDFGTGDFTIECWVYTTNISPGYSQTVLARHGASGGTIWIIQILNGGTSRIVLSGSVVCAGTTVAANTWTHIAFTRSGTSLRAFNNGVLITTVTDSTSLSGTQVLTVGAQSDIAESFIGYIDDVRITKGVARYTTNFTPPTSQLQDQ